MILILGLDGLEYDFVKKWHLTGLMQNEYGRIKVPISKKGVPLTAEVWAAFLTGKYVRGIEFVRPFWMEKLLAIIKFVRRYIKGVGVGLSQKIVSAADFPKLHEKTFLDFTNSKAINAPFCNYQNDVLRVTNALSKGLPLNLAVKSLKAIYKRRKREILEELNDATQDVIFAYMHFPDILHHFLFNRISEIKQHYLDLDRYVSQLNHSGLRLIISDHGFDLKTKNHSDYGFYSSNVDLEWQPEKITDFHRLIREAAIHAHTFDF